MSELSKTLKISAGLILTTGVFAATAPNNHAVVEQGANSAETSLAHIAMVGRIATSQEVSTHLIARPRHNKPHHVIPAPDLSTVQGRARYIFTDLTKHGITKVGAAGVLGNWGVEVTNLIPDYEGGELGQWQDKRWDALEKYAAARHEPVDNLSVEDGYFLQEVDDGPYAAGDYSNVRRLINHTSSTAMAAYYVSTYYEQPSDPNLAKRECLAHLIYVGLVEEHNTGQAGHPLDLKCPD